eukprot:712074-Lingulodinium_polyedra.AAC.1
MLALASSPSDHITTLASALQRSSLPAECARCILRARPGRRQQGALIVAKLPTIDVFSSALA